MTQKNKNDENLMAQTQNWTLNQNFLEVSKWESFKKHKQNVNTCILQKDARPMGGKILLIKYFGLRI